MYFIKKNPCFYQINTYIFTLLNLPHNFGVFFSLFLYFRKKKTLYWFEFYHPISSQFSDCKYHLYLPTFLLNYFYLGLVRRHHMSRFIVTSNNNFETHSS